MVQELLQEAGMDKKPIELVVVKAGRGEFDAVALLRKLMADIEASEVKPKVMLVVCGGDEGAKAYRLDVRVTGGAPLLMLGLLEAAKASILKVIDPEDPAAS